MPGPVRRKLRGAWREHPWLMVAIWLIVSLTLAVAGACLGIRSVIPGPASTQALFANAGELRAIEAGIPRYDVLMAVIAHPESRIDSPDFQRSLDDLHAALKSYEGQAGRRAFRRVETIGHTMADEGMFASRDGRHALLIASGAARIDSSDKELSGIPALIEEWRASHPGFEAWFLSEGTADNEIFELVDRDLDSSLLYTLPLTFAVLAFVFGSLAAAAIPLAVALVSLAASLGLTAILSHLLGPVSVTAAQLVVLLVLAIGVDYSLFMVSRLREELDGGLAHFEAMSRVRRSVGPAIFWSGITVALSMLGLYLVGDSILTSMATVSLAAVLVTMIGTLGALPSLLLLLGPRLEAGRIPCQGERARGQRRVPWVGLSIRHPVLTLAAAGSLMLPLAIAAGGLNLGTTIEPLILPSGLQVRRAAEELSLHFPDMSGVDFSLILRDPAGTSLEDNEGAQELLAEVSSFEQVEGPLAVDLSGDGSVGRYQFIALGSANGKANRDLSGTLEKLAAGNRHGVEAYLAGTLPFVAQDAVRYRSGSITAFGAVLGSSFVFLLIAFRSIVVPIKAILLNLLSTAAAFGSLALIFQDGPFPAWRFGIIESFVPPLLFAILFGLSMDYHVLLVSRIREEAFAGRGTAEAVREGIEKTWGSIGGAAAIMISVFSVIAALRLPIMKELGSGLAIAVFLDATIVRAALLPAAMVALGRWNWYLPAWLGRMLGEGRMEESTKGEDENRKRSLEQEA